jgi:hypothetical protein
MNIHCTIVLFFSLCLCKMCKIHTFLLVFFVKDLLLLGCLNLCEILDSLRGGLQGLTVPSNLGCGAYLSSGGGFYIYLILDCLNFCVIYAALL